MWLESTIHMNKESGWAVLEETVGILGYLPPHMGFRAKTSGLFVQERFLGYTVEPLYNGHIGAGRFVRYKEVSFIGRLVQECICNPYYML